MSHPAAGPGMVHEAGGGVYRVWLDGGGEVEASLRGRVKQDRRTGDRVVVGDRVDVAPAGSGWAVERVHPRGTELVRRGLGGRLAKVLAANVDQVLAVVAARDPDPTPSLVDRLMAVAESSGVPPVLVVNKVDLPGGRETAEELRRLYEGVGYRVVGASAATEEGMEGVADILREHMSVLMGPSGAGKSSLLNALHPDLALRTGELSARTGRGRHTTVSSRLIRLECGGVVADTPGIGDVGTWGMSPEDVAHCFPEIVRFEPGCRFGGCAHLKEPDCGVRQAVDEGLMAGSRYRSYVTLREEAAAAGERRPGG